MLKKVLLGKNTWNQKHLYLLLHQSYVLCIWDNLLNIIF